MVDFNNCPECGRMVGIRGGKVDIHYIAGGIMPSLLDDPNEPQLIKSKPRCGSSGKPFVQSSITARERDITKPESL
jgi:hypothetical protein|tara:strand:+ start:1310 stop:1537 length:228 start_codon:yes stop_codon:yes gene_type:complete